MKNAYLIRASLARFKLFFIHVFLIYDIINQLGDTGSLESILFVSYNFTNLI
jgi:hypothetical protein